MEQSSPRLSPDRRLEAVRESRTRVVCLDLDYFVICACGWCSLPLVAKPDVVVCEACDVLAAGRRAYARYCAPRLHDAADMELRLWNAVYAAVHSTIPRN